MFAIIEVGGKQYTVKKGDTVVVDKLDGEVEKSVRLERVLLIGGEKTELGSPVIKGAYVSAKIVKTGKGQKIEVRRFKAKVRERRKIGFRPMLTTLEIEDIHTS